MSKDWEICVWNEKTTICVNKSMLFSAKWNAIELLILFSHFEPTSTTDKWVN